MEEQPRGEGYQHLIHEGRGAHSACEHRCKCHRGVVTVCVILCILTSLLAFCCAVFICSALVDVNSLRAEVKDLRGAECKPCEATAGVDSHSGSDTSVDEDSEEYVDGSGDDFELLQDDEFEEDNDYVVPRLVRRSAQASKPGESKAGGKKPRDKATSNRKKGKGKKHNKDDSCRGGRKLKSPLAAQFDAMVPDELFEKYLPYDHLVNTEDCRPVVEMNGMLCRNRSFTSDVGDVTSMFRPAPWVTKKKSPLLTAGPGVYTARACGVYLVFAQVMFTVELPIRGVTVEQMRINKTTKEAERVQRLICNQGQLPSMREIDIYEDDDEKQVLQSCTVNGLFKLKAGDVLQIHIRGPNGDTVYPRIDRNSGSTYFGVVQLNKDK